MTLAYPAELNLAQYCLAMTVRETPGKEALIVVSNAETGEASERWTFAEFENCVLRVAAGLRETGFLPGDRLLIRLDNTSTFPILFLAAIAAGLVAVPASSQLTAEEASFLLADSEANGVALAEHLPRGDIPEGIRVLSETDVRGLMRHPTRAGYAKTAANDPAYLLYTSGTTARPKGVLHAHRVGLGRSPTYQGWYAITHDDRMLHAGAFNWTYTLGTGLIDPWANGATALIFDGEKRPEVWPALIRSTRATLFAAVPSLIRQILKYASPGHIDLGRLRHALIAGEKPPEDLFAAWRERTGLELYEALGMSEISTYISTSPKVPRRPGTAGKPQAGRRVAILPVEGGETPLPAGQEGLIAVHRSDPGLMLGYWKRPEEEAEVFRGEWFLGGDVGIMDADGYVTHMGRANDIMKALGYRVAPQEVEAALALCPGVAEVACAEVKVRADVSVIGAYIVTRPGAELDAETVNAFASQHLAAYKCPREVTFIDALPRTPNGKVKRNALAALKAHVTAD
ncbi:MAG TPA: acyl-CoA synthetase [Hyphomicrobium sp.]|nr:acyl-CoA synthetase [Hyphomicrobium sp.]